MLVQRVWALGPKRTGPNFLLSSDRSSSSPPQPSSSLFSLPRASVVRLSAKQEKKSSAHPAQADIAGWPVAGPQQVEDPAARPSESAEVDAQSELSAKVCCCVHMHNHTSQQDLTQLSIRNFHHNWRVRQHQQDARLPVQKLIHDPQRFHIVAVNNEHLLCSTMFLCVCCTVLVWVRR